jgi:hypothetical protein
MAASFRASQSLKVQSFAIHPKWPSVQVYSAIGITGDARANKGAKLLTPSSRLSAKKNSVRCDSVRKDLNGGN